jgi:hypothetical protein
MQRIQTAFLRRPQMADRELEVLELNARIEGLRLSARLEAGTRVWLPRSAEGAGAGRRGRAAAEHSGLESESESESSGSESDGGPGLASWVVVGGRGADYAGRPVPPALVRGLGRRGGLRQLAVDVLAAKQPRAAPRERASPTARAAAAARVVDEKEWLRDARRAGRLTRFVQANPKTAGSKSWERSAPRPPRPLRPAPPRLHPGRTSYLPALAPGAGRASDLTERAQVRGVQAVNDAGRDGGAGRAARRHLLRLCPRPP